MLSDNIRNYRKENNLSQDELAEKLGVSRQSISLWENGQTPTLGQLIRVNDPNDGTWTYEYDCGDNILNKMYYLGTS